MNSVALNINILILTDNMMIIKLNQDKIQRIEVYFYSIDILQRNITWPLVTEESQDKALDIIF